MPKLKKYFKKLLNKQILKILKINKKKLKQKRKNQTQF